MSRLFKRSLAWYAAVGVVAMAASAGCAGTANNPVAAPSLTAVPGPSETPSTPADPAGPAAPSLKPPAPAAPAWPTPEDCVSYDPATLTVHYEAGIYQVGAGSKVVMRLPGGPGEIVGQQGLALAQRFRKHCFLGRDNTREDRNSYIFDYWRNASGMTPDIPEEDEACSSYDRTNLTVEDMGGGYGWRVKDHDHVLHVFDNESDARNGKLVLSKYHQICFLGNGGDDDQELVSYSR